MISTALTLWAAIMEQLVIAAEDIADELDRRGL